MESYAGIDWAAEEHALCAVAADGERRTGEMFENDEGGIRELIWRMRKFGVRRVAIEGPDGLLVDRLLEAGFRWACDKRLGGAVACLEDSTRHYHA